MTEQHYYETDISKYTGSFYHDYNELKFTKKVRTIFGVTLQVYYYRSKVILEFKSIEDMNLYKLLGDLKEGWLWKNSTKLLPKMYCKDNYVDNFLQASNQLILFRAGKNERQ